MICDTVVNHHHFIEGLAMMGLKSRSSSRCSMGRKGILLKIMSFISIPQLHSVYNNISQVQGALEEDWLKGDISIINDFWVLGITSGKGRSHFHVWSWDFLSKR